MKISSTAVFIIYNNKNVSWAQNLHIEMISEWSHDTEHFVPECLFLIKMVKVVLVYLSINFSLLSVSISFAVWCMRWSASKGSNEGQMIVKGRRKMTE